MQRPMSLLWWVLISSPHEFSACKKKKVHSPSSVHCFTYNTISIHIRVWNYLLEINLLTTVFGLQSFNKRKVLASLCIRHVQVTGRPSLMIVLGVWIMCFHQACRILRSSLLWSHRFNIHCSRTRVSLRTWFVKPYYFDFLLLILSDMLYFVLFLIVSGTTLMHWM